MDVSSVTPTGTTRVGLRQRGLIMVENIGRQQRELEDINQQLASGRRLTVPSTDPADAAVAMQLRKRLEGEDRYETTLRRHSAQLAEADNALGEATEVIRSVHQVALDMANSGVSASEMDSQIDVVLSAYEQLLSLGNSQIQGSYLFAGDRLTDTPFVRTTPGVVYRGGDPLSTQVAPDSQMRFTVDGGEAFGGRAARVRGSADLSPGTTAGTRLRDLGGVTGQGVTAGSVFLSDGTNQAVIDLADADTLGDVADRINNAAVGSLVAAVTPTGLQITGAGAMTFRDVGGTVARDLGMQAESVPGPLVSGDPEARLTELTPVAALPAGLDLASGMTMTLGDVTKTIDFATSATVGDMLNEVRSAFPALHVEINAAGTGIDVLNTVQGQGLRIDENGGTTAADLGLRSFSADSLLDELNGGEGVRTTDEGPDFEITDSLGATVSVEIGGLSTVGDVIAAINASGSTVTAAFGTPAGIVLTDTAGGPDQPRVRSLAGSASATDLGIEGVGTAGVIAGDDVNPVEVRGVFTSMERLVDALRDKDIDAIRAAASRLEGDQQTMIRVRGKTGALAREYEQRTDRVADRRITAKTLLSELEDVDYGEAVARFQTLQTALEATYRSGGALMQLSLMDFLG